MLAACIVQGNAAIFTACDEQVTVGGIGYGANRPVKLSKVVTDACFLNVKDTHSARVETTGENWKCRVGSYTEGLINRT